MRRTCAAYRFTSLNRRSLAEVCCVNASSKQRRTLSRIDRRPELIMKKENPGPWYVATFLAVSDSEPDTTRVSAMPTRPSSTVTPRQNVIRFPRFFSAYCRAKAAEDLQLPWIDARLVLGMPLHRKYESPVRMLERFDCPVFGIESRYPQIGANLPYRLMMARVHLPRLC